MSSNIQSNSIPDLQFEPPARSFHHRLIMRDYRQIKPPLEIWVSHLRNTMHNYYLRKSCFDSNMEVNLSDWFWQAADIFIFAGQFRQASDICYAHIQLMLNLSHALRKNDCLWYAFKSWINLARIDRLSKKYESAYEKLEAHKHWRLRVFEDHRSLSNIVSVAVERVRREYQIEKIKLGFSMHQVRFIIEEFSTIPLTLYNHHAFIVDALILAYIQIGLIHEALYLAENMQTVKPLFEFALIRTQEIRWSYFHDQVDTQTLIDLYQIMLQRLMDSSAQLIDLILSLHLARLLTQLKLTQYAMPLIRSCLGQAIKLNDEILKADVLAFLFSIRKEHDYTHLEDDLVALYHKTYYPSVRAMLVKAYPELKHVEINQDFHQFSMLAHDLMLLSSSYI